MARFVHYRCPDCGGTFRWLHHPSDSPPPDRCTLCNAWVSEDEPPEEVFVPQAPGIAKSNYAKSIDQTYRATEEASIARANDAAGQLEDAYRKEDRESPFEGDPAVLREFQRNQVAEMRSGLKITDMKDPSSMREGDNAAVNKPVQVPGAGFQSFEGATARDALGGGGGMNAPFVSAATRDHSARASAMIRAGQIAKH
jgi:hypothetical protein